MLSHPQRPPAHTRRTNPHYCVKPDLVGLCQRQRPTNGSRPMDQKQANYFILREIVEEDSLLLFPECGLCSLRHPLHLVAFFSQFSRPRKSHSSLRA